MIVLAGGYAYDISGGAAELLTIHPRTGRLVRESSLRWPEDYPPREVAQNLRAWYGPGARARAVTMGAWEAAMLLEERHVAMNTPATPTVKRP